MCPQPHLLPSSTTLKASVADPITVPVKSSLLRDGVGHVAFIVYPASVGKAENSKRIQIFLICLHLTPAVFPSLYFHSFIFSFGLTVDILFMSWIQEYAYASRTLDHNAVPGKDYFLF